VVRLGALGLQRGDLPCRLIDLEIAPIQDLVRLFQGGDGVGRVAAPVEPFAVDAHGPEGIARPDDIARKDLTDGAGTAYHAVVADAHELVYGRRSAQYGPVIDVDMTGQLNAVGDDRVIGDLAIVRNVHIGHDPVVVAHAGYADVLRRAGVDGNVL